MALQIAAPALPDNAKALPKVNEDLVEDEAANDVQSADNPRARLQREDFAIRASLLLQLLYGNVNVTQKSG